MKVAVVGTGYVGLVTGTCLAETGNDVIDSKIIIGHGTVKTVQTAKTSQGPIFTPYNAVSHTNSLLTSENMASFTNDRFSNIMRSQNGTMRYEKRPLE